MKTTISIFGTGRAQTGDSVFELAYTIGKLLAEAGFVIANGGYGGTMLAAAKGAAEAGGEVIGVTCKAFKRGKVNEYISREISTESLDERLDTLISTGQGYVVLPGGTGTLLELAKVWELKNKGFITGAKPIILLGRHFKPIIDLVGSDDPESLGCIELLDGPREIRNYLVEKFFGTGKGTDD